MTGRYPFRCGLTTNPAPDGGPQADAVALPLERGHAGPGAPAGRLRHRHGRQVAPRATSSPSTCRPTAASTSTSASPTATTCGRSSCSTASEVVEYPVVQATLTKRYTERALRFIERNRDRPFFFYFAHAMPHKPLACSEAFYKKSGAGLYGDVLAELDWSVGRVLATLKELGLDERTLVIFTSDNGPWFGGSTGGLRGMKGTTWEGGFRVPCIARWPGRIPAGKVSDAPAVMMDLFATALAADRRRRRPATA